jgi:hypothetical protein
MPDQNIDINNPDNQIEEFDDDIETVYFDLENLLNMISTDDDLLK